jgi:hypothetical protein
MNRSDSEIPDESCNWKNFARAGRTRAGMLVFALLALSSFAHGASPCNLEVQYDMLQWVRMDYNLGTSYHFTGNANPMYSGLTRGSEFFLLKGAQGFPWDVDQFDDNYIYLWVTEYDWNDPTTYKGFANPMPWIPRCIDIPAQGGNKISSILVPDSDYNVYLTGCVQQPTQSLGYVVNEVWGPIAMTLGGSLAANANTLEVSYRYTCDAQYDNCSYKETFDFQKGLGLVRWTYYTLESGIYVQQNQSVFNTLATGGSPQPDTPCLNAKKNKDKS